MLSFRNGVQALAGLAAATVLAMAPAAAAQPAGGYPGVGRAATPSEVKAWDIDVRPDFKGLPPGSGTVLKGQDVWEARCASCHGIFGESNEVFSPLVGGTTADDVKNGRVANLKRTDFPARTTLMKVATVSTLWDYINRAMPWNEPKSLTPDEVYAVTAFLLHLGNIVPEDFTLSDKNIAEVQAKMPNRKGMTTAHAMWPGNEFGKHKPDTANKACMTNCAPASEKVSTLPEFARNAHGNLALQTRLVGAQHGVDTTRPEGKLGDPIASRTIMEAEKAKVAQAPAAGAAGAAKTAAAAVPAPMATLQKNACTACHAMDSKLMGPSFADIAKKHAARSDKVDYLTGKIRQGGSGVWGSIPMPAQTLEESEARAVAEWLAAGAAH